MTRLPARDASRRYLPTPWMVRRATLSPTAVVAAGGGVAVGLALGTAPLGVAALGVAAWLLHVGVSLLRARPRRGRPERIDPFGVHEPWRKHVQSALSNRARVRERVDSAPAGPLRDRLEEIAGRVDTVATESWQIAKRGNSLTEARRAIDTAHIDRQITELERSLADPPDDPQAVDRVTQALEAHRAQRATGERLDRVISDTRSRLELLDARMGEIVVRAVELSAELPTQAQMEPTISTLSSDVEDLVIEMEALRQALGEIRGRNGGHRALEQGPTSEAGGAGNEGQAGGLSASDQE
jgi:hypothetical protein